MDTAIPEQGEDTQNTEKKPEIGISSKTKTILAAPVLQSRGQSVVKTNPKGSGGKRTDTQPTNVRQRILSTGEGKAKHKAE